MVAGTLTGSAGGTVALNGANQINVLGDFSAAGFSLNDTLNLTVTGTAAGGAAETITADAVLLAIGALGLMTSFGDIGRAGWRHLAVMFAVSALILVIATCGLMVIRL